MTVQRDRFLLDMGIPDTETAPAEYREHVLANFLSFLRAGGVFSWSDWATMSPATCEVAEEAGRTVRGEQMAWQALQIAAALGVRQEPPAAPTRREEAEDARIRRELEEQTQAALEATG